MANFKTVHTDDAAPRKIPVMSSHGEVSSLESSQYPTNIGSAIEKPS